MLVADVGSQKSTPEGKKLPTVCVDRSSKVKRRQSRFKVRGEETLSLSLLCSRLPIYVHMGREVEPYCCGAFCHHRIISLPSSICRFYPYVAHPTKYERTNDFFEPKTNPFLSQLSVTPLHFPRVNTTLLSE